MIIEYCATRLIPKIKIDFCPNKRRLILLSCPLQLISIDSRSPSGLRQAKRHRGLPDASFQFTQPKRAATGDGGDVAAVWAVSIHAAQVGCDGTGCGATCGACGFNSRSPSGLRPKTRISVPSTIPFQFTQPKRAATRCHP